MVGQRNILETIGDNKSSAAYIRLKQMILGFELRSGQVLSERMLEATLDTSRTSVRSAMARIEAEGLLRREGRSYAVTPIDPEEIEAAHDFLIIIEPGALMIAPEDGLGPQLDNLEKELAEVESEPSVDAFIKATLRFHFGLVALSNNDFFMRAETDAATRLTRAAWLSRWIQREQRADWHEAHDVINHMRAGRRVEAADTLRMLLTRSKQQMSQLVRDEQRGLLARGIGVS